MRKESYRRDKQHRKKSTILFLIVMMTGMLFTGLLHSQESGGAVTDTGGKPISFIDTVYITLFLLIVPFAFYLYALGRRKVNRDSSPFQETRTHRIGLPVEKSQPRVSGQTLLLISLLLITFGILGWIYIREIFRQLIGK